jgi:hypothetical protein
VDPQLVQFAADLHWLANQRVAVERYNLAQQPQAFVSNPAVKNALSESGNSCLPLLVVNGTIVSRGSYPTREELARAAGVDADSTPAPAGLKLPVIQSGCC